MPGPGGRGSVGAGVGVWLGRGVGERVGKGVAGVGAKEGGNDGAGVDVGPEEMCNSRGSKSAYGSRERGSALIKPSSSRTLSPRFARLVHGKKSNAQNAVQTICIIS